jgi:glycosyltransferase involved in cell wall biosynthesis
VKEADVLHEQGYDVCVVHAPGGLKETRRHGEELMASRGWENSYVGWSPHHSEERMTYWKSSLRQRAAQWVPRALWSISFLAEVREHRVYPELAALAAQHSADLYIGHYPAGLAAAAFAADQNGSYVAYDAEDFHVGEDPDNEARIRRIDFIERRYLPRCAYVTAASDGIADALSERYPIDRPTEVYNMFPWSERKTLDGKVKDRRGKALSLYWYSQTIGLNRGLQDAIRAAGRLDEPVQLHFRGSILEGEVREELLREAQRSGVDDALYFHEKVPPQELLSRAAEHDIGLALEQGNTPNSRLCTSNKLFFYPLAPLAIAATNVPGQRAILSERMDCSQLYSPGDDAALAEILREWSNTQQLKTAKEKALEAARREWNWERESRKILQLVGKTLDRS